MAYLGLSPDYPDQYLTSPGEPLTCGDYCATMKTEFYSMRYLPRPEGCICPGEVKGTEYTTELPMTPQQIEAAVKREQSSAQGGGVALAAIAALLMLGA
jgi:hypothetical protein